MKLFHICDDLPERHVGSLREEGKVRGLYYLLFTTYYLLLKERPERHVGSLREEGKVRGHVGLGLGLLQQKTQLFAADGQYLYT